MAIQANLPNLQSMATSLQPDLLPNQSILTGRVGRVTNTSMVEADAHFDANNTATLEASYGLLHFDSNLLTDTQQFSVVGGYDRKMTARDSIGLDGAFTRFGFSGDWCYRLRGIRFGSLRKAHIRAEQPGTWGRAADRAIEYLRAEPAVCRMAGARHGELSNAPRHS